MMATSRRWWVLGAVLACLATTSVSGQNPPAAGGAQSTSTAASLQGLAQERTRLENEIRQATRNLRADEANGSLTPEANRRYYDLLGRYRQVVAAELVAKTQGLTTAEQDRIVSQSLGDANAALAPITGDAAMKGLADKIATGSAAAKTQALADIEADATIQRTRAEVAREMQRRLDAAKLRTQTGRTPRRSATGPDTVRRMRDLLQRIANVNVEAPRLPSWTNPDGSNPTSAQRQAEEFRRRLERDASIAEFMRLADGGLIVDETGNPITGDMRKRIADNAKLQLAETLKAANIDLGVLGTLFGWNDQRGNVGTQIETGVAGDDGYQVLKLIDASTTGATPQQWARAMAQVIRVAANRVQDWRAGQVPDGGNGGFTGWLYENFWAKQQVGLATATDLVGYNAEPGKPRTGVLAQIDERIAAFEKDADAAVAALTALASATRAEDLTPEQIRLLEPFGFVTKTADGTYVLSVPANANVTGRVQGNLNLPGSSILNVISAGNAIKTVLLMAAPEMAAARVGIILTSLGASERAVVVAEFVTTALTNAALDAAQQKIQTGTVQWDRLVLDTVVLNTVLPLSGQATGLAANVLATRITQNPATKKVVETLLAQSLGLSADTVLLTYWQGRVSGTGMTYEDFLANAFNGLVMRGAPVLGRGVTSLWEAIHGPSPAVKKEFTSGPKTPEEITALVESERFREQQQQFKEATERLENVLGEEYLKKNLADPELIAKVTEAAETGKLGFADLKAVFGQTPELETLMQGVNAYRLRTFDAIISTAQARARADVNVEYDARAARLKERLTGTDQLEKALAANEKERQAELGKIDEAPKAPGSKNVTSDIDRSISSAYLRNELKAVIDEAFRKNRPGAETATSAKAYDVNEYFDIFQVINRMRDAGIDLSGVTLFEPGVGKVSQTDAIAAAGLAASMQDMTPQQRAEFRKNRTATGDPARLGRLFDLAEQRLARDQQLINEELAALGKAGRDTTNPDVITRARDNVYGRRATELAQMEATLGRMEVGSQAYKELAARIEREWSYIKLAGIEAYTNFAGLDIIVNKAQMNDISVRELITGKADPTQTGKVNKGRAEKNQPAITGEERQRMIDKVLADVKAQYGPEQLTGALDDQIRFMVDHINAYFEGHESATQAGTALSKYAERAGLLLKLAGADLSKGALQQLDEIAGILVKVRGDPKALTDALSKFGGGDADAGLRKLAELLSNTMPGLKGVFDPTMFGPETGATTGARGTTGSGATGSGTNSASLNRWLKKKELERQRIASTYGSAVVAATIVQETAALQIELEKLEKEKADDERLATSYRPQDFAEVRRLEDEAKAIQQQIDNLPYGGNSDVRRNLDQQAADVKKNLDRIKGYKTVTGPSPKTPAQQIRDRRIESIKEQLKANADARDKYVAQADKEATRLAGLDKGTLLVGGPSGGLAGVTAAPAEKGYEEINKLGEALKNAFEEDEQKPVPTGQGAGGAIGSGATGSGAADAPKPGCAFRGNICGTPGMMLPWEWNPDRPIFSGMPVRTGEDITKTAELLKFIEAVKALQAMQEILNPPRTMTRDATTPTGTLTIGLNGVGTLTAGGKTYPVVLGRDGAFTVYPAGSTITTSGLSLSPIALTLPALLPAASAISNGDGTVTYPGVPLTNFPDLPGGNGGTVDLGGLNFQPPPKTKPPTPTGGGGDSTTGLAVDGSGPNTDLGEEKGMGWGERGSFEPNPDPRTANPPIDIFDLGVDPIGPDYGGGVLVGVQFFVVQLSSLTVPTTVSREPAPEPGGLWSWFRSIFDPRASVSSSRAAWSRSVIPARSTGRLSSLASIDAPTTAADAPALDAVFVSTGLATGQAFEMTAINGGPRPVRLQTDGVVLEPLVASAADRVRKSMSDAIKRRGARAPAPSTASMNGYCLEYHKVPPAVGALFRVAAPAVQQRFAALQRVLEAEQKLEQLKQLVADLDPVQYFHQLRQWAIWSQAEGFGEQAFAKEFVEHARLNALAAKQPWSAKLAAQISSLVPHRWQEITKILQEAAKGGR